MNDIQHTICRTVCEWVAEHFAGADVVALPDDDTDMIYEARRDHQLLCCAWVSRNDRVRVVFAPGLRRTQPFAQLPAHFAVAAPCSSVPSGATHADNPPPTFVERSPRYSRQGA